MGIEIIYKHNRNASQVDTNLVIFNKSLAVKSHDNFLLEVSRILCGTETISRSGRRKRKM